MSSILQAPSLLYSYYLCNIVLRQTAVVIQRITSNGWQLWTHWQLEISVTSTTINNYVCIHLIPPFPLISFVVNMMYLQIIYQRDAL